ncbi:MAG: FMN-binding protein [Alphaproteobacteria bacterium]|nr:FMN-binding protein [Alphaproteobacteria bacterium]
MSQNGKPPGRLAGKLMLSGALILASGAYAWHEAQNAPAAASAPTAPVPKLAVLPPSGPEPQPKAESVPEAAEVPAQPVPAAPNGALVTEEKATPTMPQTQPSADAQSPAVAQTQDRPDVLASNAPPITVPPPAPTIAAPIQRAGRYADGDYTGRPADAVWGLIQVKVSIRGGVITDVECPDYPNHRRRSIQINDWALPMLAQEVIAAQSAEVDIITQATTTSVGYRESLANALAQARS